MTAPALVFAATPEQNAALAEWAAARIPHLFGGALPPCVAGAVLDRAGRIAAVVAFYNWQGPPQRCLQVSLAAEGFMWARPPVIRAMLHYAFAQAGANLLHVGTPHRNEATIRFLRKIGFRPEGVLRHRYGPRQHAAMYSMTAAEWRASRWFKELPPDVL